MNLSIFVFVKNTVVPVNLLISGSETALKMTVPKFRFKINNQFEGCSLAEDLRIQMNINRFQNVDIKTSSDGSEIIVQVPETSKELEETLGSFMESYQTGNIME